jgi:hypothetical protein
VSSPRPAEEAAGAAEADEADDAAEADKAVIRDAATSEPVR